MVPNEVQIVDSATLPEKPIKPKKGLTLLLSLILGLLAGSGFVVTRYLMNRRIRTSEDVEQQFGLPVLGMVPDLESVRKEESRSGIQRLDDWRRKLWHKSN
jgi:capsular polysaccharide biosynthesis protein